LIRLARRGSRSILFCIWLTGTAQPAVGRPAEGAPERWQDLSTQVQQTAKAADLPGYALVVLDRNAPVLYDTTWPEGTPLRWGSITKTFTALAALKLAEQGKLDLDDPVRGLVPKGVYRNPWQADHPLTTRHLLELTAGLPDLSRQEWDDNTPHSLHAALTRRERTLLWPPGFQHSYSNTSPGITAAVIETASGRSFAEYLSTTVLRPLGMSRATLAPLPDLPGGFAADGVTPLPYWHVTFRAFGALNAPVPELTRALVVLLNGGSLNGEPWLAPESMRALFGPGTTPAVAAGLAVGYGAGTYGWVSNGHVFHGHGGDADGYRSRYGLLPEAGRGYLIAINADRPDVLRQLQRLVEAALTDDLPAEPPAALSDANIDRYVGTYYPTAARFDVARWAAGDAARAVVSRNDRHLEFRRNGRQTTLLAVGGGAFRRPGDPVVTAVFFKGEDGALYLQGELGNFANVAQCPGFLPHCHQ
jgi:CubicO group peptidase (beta-lactamase class C family)